MQESQQKSHRLQQQLDNSEQVQRDFVKLSQSLQMELEAIRQSEKVQLRILFNCVIVTVVSLNEIQCRLRKFAGNTTTTVICVIHVSNHLARIVPNTIVAIADGSTALTVSVARSPRARKDAQLKSATFATLSFPGLKTIYY